MRGYVLVTLCNIRSVVCICTLYSFYHTFLSFEVTGHVKSVSVSGQIVEMLLF